MTPPVEDTERGQLGTCYWIQTPHAENSHPGDCVRWVPLPQSKTWACPTGHFITNIFSDLCPTCGKPLIEETPPVPATAPPSEPSAYTDLDKPLWEKPPAPATPEAPPAKEHCSIHWTYDAKCPWCNPRPATPLQFHREALEAILKAADNFPTDHPCPVAVLKAIAARAEGALKLGPSAPEGYVWRLVKEEEPE